MCENCKLVTSKIVVIEGKPQTIQVFSCSDDTPVPSEKFHRVYTSGYRVGKKPSLDVYDRNPA